MRKTVGKVFKYRSPCSFNLSHTYFWNTYSVHYAMLGARKPTCPALSEAFPKQWCGYES